MKKFFLALALVAVGLIFFSFVLAAQPTKMSLQGKVEGLSSGDLGVKISDQNSCLDGVFFDHNYIEKLSSGKVKVVGIKFSEDVHMMGLLTNEFGAYLADRDSPIQYVDLAAIKAVSDRAKKVLAPFVKEAQLSDD